MGCTHSGYFAGEFLSTSSAGRTTDLLGVLASPTKVSIHVLREEDDRAEREAIARATEFLSTSSARRTTLSQSVMISPFRNFYPRPPRGGRPQRAEQLHRPLKFLSTSSARRTTKTRQSSDSGCPLFLSTSSARRTTRKPLPLADLWSISIHVLREEDDAQAARGQRHRFRISIHVLREEDDIAWGRPGPHPG